MIRKNTHNQYRIITHLLFLIFETFSNYHHSKNKLFENNSVVLFR